MDALVSTLFACPYFKGQGVTFTVNVMYNRQAFKTLGSPFVFNLSTFNFATCYGSCSNSACIIIFLNHAENTCNEHVFEH